MSERIGRARNGPLTAEVRVRFWDALRGGVSVAAAARTAGASKWTGQRWLSEAGGVIPHLDDGQGLRIGFVERCRIEELLRAGLLPARIAALLGRARSSIGRELGRCPAGRYRAVTANGQAAAAKKRPNSAGWRRIRRCVRRS